jgi:hypothetical protein
MIETRNDNAMYNEQHGIPSISDTLFGRSHISNRTARQIGLSRLAAIIDHLSPDALESIVTTILEDFARLDSNPGDKRASFVRDTAGEWRCNVVKSDRRGDRTRAGSSRSTRHGDAACRQHIRSPAG